MSSFYKEQYLSAIVIRLTLLNQMNGLLMIKHIVLCSPVCSSKLGHNS